MTERKNQTVTLPILDAIDSLLSEIRKSFPEVPTDIAVVLGASGKMKRGAFHGRFSPDSWEGEAKQEITLSGESLARGAEATLGTLIHECVHAVAHATGVQDTSRQGRYHNKRFKAIGEKMGLKLTEDSKIGWSVTELAPGTAEKYKSLPKLAEALKAYRSPKESLKPTAPKTTIKVGCNCETDSGKQLTVTVPIKWFEQTALVCDYCNRYLNPVE